MSSTLGAMLMARSVEEALLYLDLHFCSCERPRLELDHGMDRRGDVFVLVYEGRCERCGASGHGGFALDTSEEVPYPAMGGTRPSVIIGPEEYLRISDDAASRIPVDPRGSSSDQRAMAGLLTEDAIRALEELRKFVPEGATEVPVENFGSQAGIAARNASPERFRAADIDERLAAYRRSLPRTEST